MKIGIVSYYSSNSITPRGFRVDSLSRILKELDHVVSVISLHHGESIQVTSTPARSKRFLRKKINGFLNFMLPGGRDVLNVIPLVRALKGKEFDLVISVGLPMCAHIAVAIARATGALRAKTMIADYGDPFSANPAGNVCLYAKGLEKWVLTNFDAIVIATEEARSAFSELARPGVKISVIPQAAPVVENLPLYQKNSKPTFGYAGVFYEKIRNPKEFFNYLSSTPQDFKFSIFTDLSNSESMRIVSRLRELLGDRLSVRGQLSRLDCIAELSKMDFLINFSNHGGLQVPSKLIDYALSGRPFVSVTPDQIEFTEFAELLEGDYSNRETYDLDRHRGSEVAREFLSLCNA